MLEQVNIEKEQLRKIVLWFMLGSWLLRAWQGLLLIQLHEAPFISVEADNTFWFYHALQIPYYCIHYQVVGGIMDSLWLVLTFICLTRPYKIHFQISLFFIFLNYFIVYNSVSTHHEHILIGLLFFLVLIAINEPKNLVLSFVALRYYCVFVLFSAFCWKLYRGSLFFPNQLSEILKRQHIDYLIDFPEAYFSQFISYLIANPTLSNLFWYGGWILEAVFVIGFFTRKYDKLLLGLFLAFFIMDYFIMNLCFVEFCIFALVFYPWKGIWSYYDSKLHSPIT